MMSTVVVTSLVLVMLMPVYSVVAQATTELGYGQTCDLDLRQEMGNLNQEMGNLKQEVGNLKQEMLAEMKQLLQCNTRSNPETNEFRVFLAQSKHGANYLTLPQATATCLAEGAQLATVSEMRDALKAGMEMCYCGWLSDGSARYPVQTQTTGCGKSSGTQALIACSGTGPFDAYCYKPRTGEPTFRVFHINDGQGIYKMTFEAARDKCASTYGTRLATLAEMEEAWRQGLEVCACGWLADGTSHYPMQKTTRNCGGVGGPRIVTCGGTDRLWDGYCYRP